MLEEVNVRFSEIQTLYKAVNVYHEGKSSLKSDKVTPWTWQTLPKFSATMGREATEELCIGRNERPQDICRFSSITDVSFRQICDRISGSSGHDGRFIQCIRTLSSLIKGRNLQIPGLHCTHISDQQPVLEQVKEHEAYKTWINPSGNAHDQTLYLLGDPDSISSVLPPLLATETESLRAISFLFDSNDDRRSTAYQMLASLSLQLLRLKPSLFDHVSRLYDLISEKNEWRVEKLVTFFRSLLGCPSHGQTLCLISRVDECKPGKGSLSQHFSDWIVSLCTSGGSNKFIITSRKALNGSTPSMTLDLNNDIKALWQQDFESFLETHISTMLLRRPGVSPIRDDIKKNISLKRKQGLLDGDSIDKIIKLMFILLTAVFELITISEAKQTLRLLQTSKVDIYYELLGRIAPPHRVWARNCLSWITRAIRPLRLDELTVAIAIQTNGFSTLDIDEEISLDLGWDLKRVFGDLVKIENGVVQLVETSLGDFLTSQHHACEEICLICCDSHIVIAQRCLTYLSSLRQEQGDSLQPPLPAERRYTLLDYAVQYWPVHYQNAEQEGVGEPHVEFDLWFEDTGLMLAWCVLRNYYQAHVGDTRPIEPISTAAEIGCRGYLRKMCVVFCDKYDLTFPLEIAIQSGDEKLVDILIDFGATSPEAVHVAASYGHENLVKRFVTDENLLYENAEGLTPLQCASQSGSVSTVDSLLLAGSKVDAANKKGLTPLHIACQFGQLDIIRRLLQVGDVDPNFGDAYGSTPLHMACLWQQPGSVRCLLSSSKIVRLNAVDEHYSSALHHAAASGRVDILDLLVRKHPDSLLPDEDYEKAKDMLVMKDDKGLVPLHLAARAGHAEVATQLLSLDNSDDSGTLNKNSNDSIPLHLAAESGQSSVAKLLVEHGSTVKEQIQDRDAVGLPISLAVRGQHIGVVSILCVAHRNENISLDVFDVDGASPLHVASKTGNIEIARLLLDNGATPDIVDSNNATPLLLASQRGFVNIVGMLLKKEANQHIEDQGGVSPIMAAAKKGEGKVVEMLLEKLTDEDLPATEPMIPRLLHSASEGGHLAVVQVLLRGSKHVVDVKDEEGRTPLHLASAAGSLQVVSELLQQHANPVSRDNDGNTPLQAAATDEVAQTLWSACRDLDGVNSEEVRSETLRQAIIKGHADFVVELLGSGLDIDQSLFHLAVQNGHCEIIKRLANLVSDADSKDEKGRTPLSWAAENGHLETVQFLVIEKQADVNSFDNRNRSPLSYAAGYGRQSVVNYLLENGDTNPDPPDRDNKSPLWYASRFGHHEIVGRLLQCKVNLDIQDRYYGWTPLHAAAYDGHSTVVDELLAGGAVQDVPDERQETPLYLAAWWRYMEIVSKLIAHQAKSDLPNYQGWRPLHAAYDAPEILELLLRQPGADLDWKTSDGETVLHIATRGRIESSVKILLEKGANPLSPDDEEVTPLHLAAQENDGDLVRLMLPHAITRAQAAETTLDKVEDRRGSSPFMQALLDDNIDVVKEFINTKNAVDFDHKNKDGQLPIEVAMSKCHDNITELLLDHIVDSNPSAVPELAERCNILVWAIMNRKTWLEGEILEILQDRGKAPSDDQVPRLFELATKRDNIDLVKYLLQGRPDMEGRDEHGWTLQQIIAAYSREPSGDNPFPSEADLSNLKKPECWSTDNIAEELSFIDKDPKTLKYTPRKGSWYSWAAAARADHPINPSKKFYFEIKVINSGDDNIVGIGFGHKVFDPDEMPGWASSNWGLHGDDGGLFHDGGTARSNSSDRMFGTGDVVGCLIDPIKGTAFFTRNGKRLEGQFEDITGRLFPMVGIRSANAQISVNFDANEPDEINPKPVEASRPRVRSESRRLSSSKSGGLLSVKRA